MNALDLDTPAPYVDLDVMERNIRTMQERCRGWKVGLRPHTKTHKVPEIARMQLAAGAIGITVAKVGEAEILPGDDVLIAYPLMPEKAARVRELAKTRRVTVAIDSVEAARALQGIRTLVEVDVGVGRVGVQATDQLLEVARACSHFEGLFYWPSWLDDEGFRRAAALIKDHLGALRRAGLEARIVSGGSTPGAVRTPLIPETTEIRPGTYVFYDYNSVLAGCAAVQDCALRVLVTVVSTAVPGRCIVDGGSKTFSNDGNKDGRGFGLFPDRPGWALERMNEEHGYVKIDSPARVGDRAWVVPPHVCTTVNMHDEIWFGRGGRVEGSWKVAARGRIR